MTTTEPNDNENLQRAINESLAPAALSDMSDADIERLLNDATATPMSDATVTRLLREVKQTNPAHPSDRTVRISRGLHVPGDPPGSSKEIVMSMSNPNRSNAQGSIHRGSVAALVVSAVCLLVVLIVTARPKPVQVADEDVKDKTFVEHMGDVWKNQPLVSSVAPKIREIAKAAIGDVIETKDRERRRFSLPDGSVLFMNENTTAKIESLRKLNVTAGEVFVEVCPKFDDDNNREFFYLDTPNRKLTAIGTKFAVNASEDNTDLLVTQGKVKVDGVDETVTAGRFVRFNKSDVELSVAPRASEALNWTEDLMVAAPIVPRSKYCGGALISVDPNGQEMRLSMRKYHVDVHIEDGFARTTIDQTYFNHTSSRLEGKFKFPLPADASLSRLAMYVGPKLMEGGMAERQHARNTFEQIVHKMKDPALLEWVDGTTFSMRVFPLEPRQEKRLVISYSQRLNTAYGKTHYRFPAGHNLDTVGEWSTQIRVKDGANLAYKSTSHAMEAERAKGDLVLNAAAKNELFDRDVVLEIEDEWNTGEPTEPLALASGLRANDRSVDKARRGSPTSESGSATDVGSNEEDATAPRPEASANGSIGGAYRFTRTVHEDHQYLMLRHRPELKGDVEKKNRDWVFLFETSGDRNPVLARAQIEVVRTLLKNAEHEDTFNIVTAGTRPKTFRETGVACEAKNIDEAIAWLEKSHLIGALDFEKGLQASVDLLTTNSVRPRLHVGGSTASALPDGASGGDANADDGVVQKPLNPRRKVGGGGQRAGGDREQFLVHVGSGLPVLGQTSEKELVANIPQSVRYVGVGVGKKWSRQFMKLAASRTGGYFTQINPDEKVNWRAFELLSVLNAPRLLNVSVIDNAEKLAFLTYTESIAHGEEICAIARLAKDAKLPKSLVVAGELNGKAWNQSIDVENVTDKADYLPRSWARLEIDRLIADGAAQHKADIVALSKAMYVMSPFTSLLVLENEAMYTKYKIDRGRKDHWALYPAPDTIKVVHEPFQREFARSKDAPKNVWETVLTRNPRRRSAPVAPIMHWYSGNGLNRFGNTHWAAPLNRAFDTWELELDEDSDGDGVRDSVWLDLALSDFDANLQSTMTWGRAEPQSRWLPLYSVDTTELDNLDINSDGLFDPVTRVRSWRNDFSSTVVGLASPDDFVRDFGGEAVRFDFGTVPPDVALSVANGRARYLAEEFLLEQVDEFGIELGFQQRSKDSLRRRRPELDGLSLDSKFMMRFDGGQPATGDSTRPWSALEGGTEVERLSRLNVLQELDDLGAVSLGNADFFDVPQNRFRMVLPSRPKDEAQLNLLFGSGVPNLGWEESGVLNGRALSRSSTGMISSEINPGYAVFGRAPTPRLFESRDGRSFSVYGGASFGGGGFGGGRGFRGGQPAEGGWRYRVPTFDENRNALPDVNGDFGDVNEGFLSFALQPMEERFEPLMPRYDWAPVLVLDASEGELAPIFVVDPPGVTNFNVGGNLQGRQTLDYFYDGAQQTLMRSERLSVKFLSDLIAHAPGMNSTRADLLGVVEAESKRKPKRGEIDEAARKLIQKARSTGWETVTLGSGDNAVQVHLNGAGQFAWDRTVSEGLGEQVLCDGEHLWHLYEEIGLGAKRDFTRFHRSMIGNVAPWLLAPIEELTIGADVIAIDERTVAIVPQGQAASIRPRLHVGGPTASALQDGADGDDANGSSEVVQKPLNPRRKVGGGNDVAEAQPVVCVQLMFAKNGRLKERRIVRVLDDKIETLVRVTFGRKGTIKVLNGKDKQLTKIERPRSRGAKPFGGIRADRKDLVILPLPYRDAGTILARVANQEQFHVHGGDYSKWPEEEALALITADTMTQNKARIAQVIMSRFFKKGDTRAGLYVLMANANPQRIVKAAKNGQKAVYKPVLNYQPNKHVSETHKALVRFARHLATASTDNEFDESDLKAGSFLHTICRARNTYYRWYQKRAIGPLKKAGLAKEVDRAIGVVGSLRSPTIGWTILRTMQPYLDHSEFYAKFADAAKKYENAPHIAWFVRHERARTLFLAKEPDEASKVYAELLTKTLKAGFNPGIDKQLREQFIKHRGQRNWSEMCRQTAEKLIEDELLRTAITLSKQLRDLGDVDVANGIFEKAIAKLEPKKRPDVAMLAVQRMRELKQDNKADKLLMGMLENRWVATSASLWRYGSELAEARGKTAEALRRLERAIAIEYILRPDVINLQQTRIKYAALMLKYEKIADASATLEQAPPKDLADRIVRAADQWRSMEDDETQVCQLASRILTKLGERDLAWDYATTPVGTQPGSQSWQSLAKHLGQQKEIEKANEAYVRAFEFEQTNPQILWDHANLLRNSGRESAAQPLLKKITESKWQPRFNNVKNAAKQIWKSAPPVAAPVDPAADR